MGYIPPGSRTEELRQNDPDLVGIKFEKVEIASDPGIILRGYLFKKDTPIPSAGANPQKAIIVYFQGESLDSPSSAISDILCLDRQRRLPTPSTSALSETTPPSAPSAIYSALSSNRPGNHRGLSPLVWSLDQFWPV
ncbi:hypothetical protein QFC24_004593 [Naganishia onofrii]|uniref:Uncharacterized protein n=1 Tax=Naganishia onofrii TaxID=1851511 RepID=A0ACC2XF43_9TREE|nr:hypothetical protein QFC24_004593 [Naganishia onofrii]